MKSILDLKRSPIPRVRTWKRADGRWAAAFYLPSGIEPFLFDRPTERGLENEIVHMSRKYGHGGCFRSLDEKGV